MAARMEDPVSSVGVGVGRTKVVKKTYNPEWHESFRLSYNESGPPPTELEVDIYDWDAVGSGREFVGRVVIALGELTTEGDVQGWYDLQGADGGLVRGHDRNSSAVQLSVSLQAGLPQEPWWETRPAWILFAVRCAMAAWGLLGAAIWLRESRTVAGPPARDPGQAEKAPGKPADAARADKPKKL
jgi:hypothetical protein